MLWAVHIGNEMLTGRWELGGFAAAAVLLVIGAWRLHEEEIPRIALLTAAFFIASSMHVPVPPTTVHLLLNGLVGVVLGRRAGLAIFVGLLLQAVLLGHGGFLALGVNTCVMTLPAYVVWLFFRGLNRLPGLDHRAIRAILVGIASALWFICAILAVTLPFIWYSGAEDYAVAFCDHARRILLQPATAFATVAVAVSTAWIERRLENAPEFPLGLLVGEVAVLLTVVLNAAALLMGAAEPSETSIALLAMAHLPVAAIEGVIVGFTVGFLAKVKPELLGIAARAAPRADASCVGYGGNTSSSATSH
jgi:cobalt/nickel transport system permease protein